MEINQPSQPEAMSDLQYARLLIVDERPNQDVIKALINRGMNEESARSLVDDLQWQVKKAKKQKAKDDITAGSIVGGAGLVITAVTYFAAGDHGYFIVAWGSIAYGAFRLIRGFNNK